MIFSVWIKRAHSPPITFIFNETSPLIGTDDEFRRILSIYAASTLSGNRTSDALHEALKGERLSLVEEIPFSSAQKWSAISFDSPTLSGVYVLGAPEMLQPYLQDGAQMGEMIQTWSDQGLRVLLFAYRPGDTPLSR